jgi:hypothetical protein
LLTLLFLERIPLRDSILMALDPGRRPPLPRALVEADGFSMLLIFLFEPEAASPTFAAGL